MKITVTFEFEPRDLWVGLYWKKIFGVRTLHNYYHFYLCLVPMFPIHVVYVSDILEEKVQ